ncbi:putative odorant-binding protein A10 [Phymastichus coffea]|uniref:putative odorant-binding protein A10 n=1 Tax=Phymastichus coffea TaxID=108790 RepID=UPI00273BDF36|nr:putative odorant-binding protein A10 [Phymastichus coffea]
MKHACVATSLVVLILALSVRAQNVDLLLRNKILVTREISCVLGRMPCDIIGKQITGLLPEALNNNCRRCTREEASNAKKLIAFMKKNRPNDWITIVQMYGKPKAV